MSKIERIPCGSGNCFLIHGDKNSILVDTCRAQFRDKILEKCELSHTALIVLTHGHIDHAENAAFLSKRLNVPVAMHKADYELTKNNMAEPMYARGLLGKIILGLSRASFKQEIEAFEPEIFLREGDSLAQYGVSAEVVELPGHTRGSIGIKVGGAGLLVGDALMNMVYPSISPLYGDRKTMEESAKKISALGGIQIHFGHGPPLPNKNWR